MVAEIAVNELKQLVLALGEHLALRSRGGCGITPDVLRTFWVIVNKLSNAISDRPAIPSVMHG